MSRPVVVPLDAIEATLLELIPRLTPAPSPRGRPEVLPGALLWAGLLVCILRSSVSQQAIWRLLSQAGLWHFPQIPVSAEAVRIRLQRSGPDTMQQLFTQVTAELTGQYAGNQSLAPFATGVYALDDSTLDQVARTLPALREAPAGDARLLPGKLSTAFDIRRQLFHTVLTSDLPRQNERVAARDLVATLPVGSLLLTDLGYFSFPWFDELSDAGYFFLSKLRAKTSYEVVHVLSDHQGVRDELVWLGAHRADRAKHLVRVIQVPIKGRVRRYVTNVRDPALLPVADVVRLYARRWDIELAFKLIKQELGLHLLWSAKWELILTQVWGVLVIAQIVASLRAQIAARARVELLDVSMALLLRDLPHLVRYGQGNLIDRIAALPLVKGGYLRHSRRKHYVLPHDVPVTPPPPNLPLTRTPRTAGRKCGPNRTNQPSIA